MAIAGQWHWLRLQLQLWLLQQLSLKLELWGVATSTAIAAARPLQRLTPLLADVLLSFVKLLKPKNTTISNAYDTLLSLCSFFWSSHIYLIIVLFKYLLNKSVQKTSGCFYFSITNIFECILKCILQYYAPVNRF